MCGSGPRQSSITNGETMDEHHHGPANLLAIAVFAAALPAVAMLLMALLTAA